MTPVEFITAYEKALATQQWNEVEPLIHDKACVTFSNGTVHNGKDAIKQAYEKNFSLIKNEEYSMDNVHWIYTNSNTAVYVYEFVWQGLINGQPAEGKGRGTATIIFAEGKWQLIAEQLGAT